MKSFVLRKFLILLCLIGGLAHIVEARDSALLKCQDIFAFEAGKDSTSSWLPFSVSSFFSSFTGYEDSQIQNLIKNHQWQEAIWLANRKGYLELKEGLQATLFEILTNEKRVTLSKKIALIGVNEIYLATFQSGIHAVFKPHPDYWIQINKKYAWAHNVPAEIDAYLIDQILDLNIVPMTVERTIDGMKGSLQVFVVKDQNKDPNFVDHSHPDFKKMKLLDYLIRNGDRHSNNFLILPDKIAAIDHGQSFLAHISDIGTVFTFLHQVPIDSTTLPFIHRMKTHLTPEVIWTLLHERHAVNVIEELIYRRKLLLNRSGL